MLCTDSGDSRNHEFLQYDQSKNHNMSFLESRDKDTIKDLTEEKLKFCEKEGEVDISFPSRCV